MNMAARASVRDCVFEHEADDLRRLLFGFPQRRQGYFGRFCRAWQPFLSVCIVKAQNVVLMTPLIELLCDWLQGLANTLWAFAKLGKPVPLFCGAAAAEVMRRLSAFSLRDLSQILWAFAKLEHRGSAAAVSIMADHTAAILRDDGEAPAPCPEHALWRCLQTLATGRLDDMLCPAV